MGDGILKKKIWGKSWILDLHFEKMEKEREKEKEIHT